MLLFAANEGKTRERAMPGATGVEKLSPLRKRIHPQFISRASSVSPRQATGSQLEHSEV